MPLESNIKKFAVYLVTNKRLFVVILGVYLLTIPGTAPQSIGLMVLIGNLFGFVFEIPSGYIADKIGHKKALVFSKIFHIAAVASFLIGKHLSFFIAGSILMNLGKALHSGTAVAFIHETLKALKKEREYVKIVGRLRSFSFVIPTILTIFIPFFVAISYKIPFFIALIFDLIGLAAALSFVAPPRPPQTINEIKLKKFRTVIKEGRQLQYFRFAFFFALAIGAAIAMAVFRDAYQSFLKIPVIYYGVFFGASRALSSLFLIFNNRIKKALTLAGFLKWHIFIFVSLAAVLGLFPQPAIAATAFIFISAAAFGFLEIRNGYLLEIIKASKFKATLLSIGPLIETFLLAILGFALGKLITAASYQTAFAVLSAGLFTALTGLYIYCKKSPRFHNGDNVSAAHSSSSAGLTA